MHSTLVVACVQIHLTLAREIFACVRLKQIAVKGTYKTTAAISIGGGPPVPVKLGKFVPDAGFNESIIKLCERSTTHPQVHGQFGLGIVKLRLPRATPVGQSAVAHYMMK
jgi:hypothetical protein